MSTINIKKESDELFTTDELAELLEVRSDWLRKNRKSNNPIPFRPFGRNKVRYSKLEVLQWFGRKDLALRFYSTKTLSKKLKVTEEWLRINRTKGKNPIPHRPLLGLVRYNETELSAWIKNCGSKENNTQ